ncbi:MAG: hypothetical protein H3C62_02205, partial [Gemmatimonadaceae bacterium]|nr:hypothetical protein [Gemmatimonadaceae bacterium]
MNNAEAGWRALWREHPALMRLLLWTFVGSLAAAGLFTWRAAEYLRETRALRAGMSHNDKLKADLALASDARRLQVTMALAVRQARATGDLYVAIAVDSGVLH